MIVGILALIVFSLNGSEVKAQACGQARNYYVTEGSCESADPNNNCAVNPDDETYSCLTWNGACTYLYEWTGCYKECPVGVCRCVWYHSYKELPCGDYGGGGGGGGFNWFSCPSGQAKSCGSPSEALAQNKYACTNRAYCDNHFSPELIGGACAYQDNGDPYKWDCQWNCSCCPTGSYRSCTQGSQYTVDVRIELPLDEAGIAAKVSCVQWHGHDDIFVSNDCLPIGQNCNNHDGQWQDWQLTCIQNTCGCVAPPTAACA